MAQLVQQSAIGELAQAFSGHGRAGDVAAQPLQASAIVGGDGDGGVQAREIYDKGPGMIFKGNPKN